MKNTGVNIVRIFLVAMGLASAAGCISFGKEQALYQLSPGMSNYIIADTGLNGAAAGLGMLSGLCFVALSITYLKRQE